MPELPEVETTVRGLAPFLEGQRLVTVSTFRPDLRRPFPADLAQRLTGATVTHLARRAKYGILSTDRDDHMIFHLGMSGRWRTEGGEAGYFAALGQTNMAQRSGDMLVLSGPQYTMRFIAE